MEPGTNEWESIFSQFAFGIFPRSEEETGIPLTLIQAAQAGLPIFSTDVGSVIYIVKQGVNGSLVGCSTSELTDVLKLLIGDVDLRAQHGAAGKVRAAEFPPSRNMVANCEKLYLNLLK